MPPAQLDYKKNKKMISQIGANCQIREWEPATENKESEVLGTLLDRESNSAVYDDIIGLLNERYIL